MTSVYFFITLIIVLYLAVKLLLALLRRANARVLFFNLAGTLITYAVIWVIFYFKQSDIAVPAGTDICFDDWCATVTEIDQPQNPVTGDSIIQTERRFIVVHIKMSNHAKGIVQKPSEPRVYIIDNAHHKWLFSRAAQHVLEQRRGIQVPLNARLGLGQSLETQMAFNIPVNATGLKVLIEEGPFITRLLFPEDRRVFVIDLPGGH